MTSDSKSICLQCGRPGFNPWDRRISWIRKWQRSPVFLPGKSHGRRSLVGYSPWGHKESDRTEQLHFHFHIQLINRQVTQQSFKSFNSFKSSPLRPEAPFRQDFGGPQSPNCQQEQRRNQDFPGGTADKNPSGSAGDMKSNPGPGESICSRAPKPRSHSF